ncbi:hypothetical protein D3C83_61420 [compost metagenome]
MSLVQLAEELEQAREDPAGLDAEAEQFADLSEDDTDADPVQESDQDGPGQEIRQHAQPKE